MMRDNPSRRRGESEESSRGIHEKRWSYHDCDFSSGVIVISAAAVTFTALATRCKTTYFTGFLGSSTLHFMLRSSVF
jgi:hypothetical protein